MFILLMLHNKPNINQDHRKKLKYFSVNKNLIDDKEFTENKIDNLK